eukprot:1826915-Alexandrium_andersonii.AAC.1
MTATPPCTPAPGPSRPGAATTWASGNWLAQIPASTCVQWVSCRATRAPWFKSFRMRARLARPR